MPKQTVHTSAFDFNDFFNTLPGLYLVLSPELHIIAANKAFLQETGLTAEPITGLHLLKIISNNPADLQTALQESFATAVKQSRAQTLTQVQLSLPITAAAMQEKALPGKYWTVKVTPVPDERGNTGHFILEASESADQQAYTDSPRNGLNPTQKGPDGNVREPDTQKNKITQHILEILESLPLMIWTATPDGATNYCNQRWFDYTGSDYEAMRGMGWQQFIHPDDVQTSMDIWINSVNSGEPLVVENRWRNAQDGSYRWFLGRAVPLHNSEGEIILWVGSNTDIHDQKLSQEQLQESEQQFRFLAESIPQMIWTARPDGTTDYFNNRWITYTGLSLEESLGSEAWLKALHPDDLEMAWNRWQHAVRTGDYYEVEYRIRNCFLGTYRWFLGQGIPMRDADGNIVKWFGSCTDIEDHKKTEEELLEKNLELERTNQDLDSFVYSASHDLKLPILNMAGIFDELVRVAEFKDPDAFRMIGMFSKSLEQIQTTIDELSDVVRLQKAGKREPECLILQELMQDVLVSLQQPIESSRAIITTDFSEAPELCFTRPGLKSILFNLLSNAIKYKAADKPPLIHLSTRIKDNFVELRIADNGVGLDINKHQGKLFQMFKRFHNHVNGSGLGLYIVNRLLTNHGGYINIESELNKGTTFYLYFKQKSLNHTL